MAFGSPADDPGIVRVRSRPGADLLLDHRDRPGPDAKPGLFHGGGEEVPVRIVEPRREEAALYRSALDGLST